MYRTTHEQSDRRIEQHETLYEACRAIVQSGDGIVLAGTSNALVAFWCAYDGKVKAGVGANDIEREAIDDYRL